MPVNYRTTKLAVHVYDKPCACGDDDAHVHVQGRGTSKRTACGIWLTLHPETKVGAMATVTCRECWEGGTD